MPSDIKKILKEKLHAHFVDDKDESADHATHTEAQRSKGGHYSVIIVSDQFKGKSLLVRHRMVYAALKEFKETIHALAIKAFTEEEFKIQRRA